MYDDYFSIKYRPVKRFKPTDPPLDFIEILGNFHYNQHSKYMHLLLGVKHTL